MSEQNEAQWHDEPTDYGQIGKLPQDRGRQCAGHRAARECHRFP